MRELPSQLQDLYQQGFILAAVHPFVHPCGPEPASVQRQLYRAVLIKVSDRWGHNTANGNMTAACHCTGGADIYYLSHFYLKSCLCQLLYCTTKHHNVVFMSIFHPPSDPSTGCCATVPLRLHVLLLGWLYCIWSCHIFFTVKPDCIITGLQYILRYIQEWSSFFTIWLLWIATIFNQFLSLMTQSRPSNDLYKICFSDFAHHHPGERTCSVHLEKKMCN